jgi:predicted amidohydrolase
MTVLKVATCQFPVSADAGQNAGWITRQMREAARQGARVAHFPEGALSGYAGTDFATFTGYDWDALDRAADRVRACAGELGIWVVSGSAHRFSDVSAPHNSLQVLSDVGEVIERYDKRFLGGTDPDHYSPGSHFSTWTIDGIRCGALICYDYRFPELYRHYAMLHVAGVLRALGRDHDRQAGAQRCRCPDLSGRYGARPVRLHEAMAAAGHRRRPAQRRTGARRSLAGTAAHSAVISREQ